jgi:hypothetical protein
LAVIGSHWQSLAVIGSHWQSLAVIGSHTLPLFNCLATFTSTSYFFAKSI